MIIRRCKGIFMDDEKDLHWFGEWVPIYGVFYNDEEKAREFLKSWKESLLAKLHTMTQFGEDHWIEREIDCCPVDARQPFKTIGLKVCLKGNFPCNYGYFSPRELGDL